MTGNTFTLLIEMYSVLNVNEFIQAELLEKRVLEQLQRVHSDGSLNL